MTSSDAVVTGDQRLRSLVARRIENQLTLSASKLTICTACNSAVADNLRSSSFHHVSQHLVLSGKERRVTESAHDGWNTRA